MTREGYAVTMTFEVLAEAKPGEPPLHLPTLADNIEEELRNGTYAKPFRHATMDLFDAAGGGPIRYMKAPTIEVTKEAP